jgi:hypothetical protein
VSGKATKGEANDTAVAHDVLVPDPQVCAEFGIVAMTLYRWDHDAKLNFPPATKIRNRNYRSRRELEEFKQRLLREAIAARSNDKRKPPRLIGKTRRFESDVGGDTPTRSSITARATNNKRGQP